MSSIKKAFYPVQEVMTILDKIPKGQLSSRVNELILKGLSYEQKEKIKQDYISFNEAIAKDASRFQNDEGISNTMMMSARVFDQEDEEEDYI